VRDGEALWLEDGILDASLPGAWIAAAEPGPSKLDNQHRSVHERPVS
jgi:hypothetical protein